MKKLISIVLLISLLGSVGCSFNQPPTDAQKIQMIDTTYDAVVLALNIAHREGLLTVAQKVKIDPYLETAAAALVALHKSNALDFSTALSAFDAAMVKLESLPEVKTAKANAKK